MTIEAMKMALETLEKLNNDGWILADFEDDVYASIDALRAAIEQAEQDHTYGYAKELAEAMFKQHFANDEHYASGQVVWGVNDTVIGILTQIDNMVSGMVRNPEQAEKQEPVAWQCQEHGDTEWFNCSKEAHELNPRRYIYRALYTAPPQREWQGLTDEEVRAFEVWLDDEEEKHGWNPPQDIIKYIEAKLKEKNT